MQGSYTAPPLPADALRPRPASTAEWLAQVQPGRLLLVGYALVVVGFLVLPVLIIVPISFGGAAFLQFPPRSFSLRWYGEYLSATDWIEPTLFSFRVALLTMAVATVAGTLAALALVRGRLPAQSLLQALISAPLIVPAVIYAIAVLFVFAPLRLNGTIVGFVLAHTVLAIPYVVLIVSASLARVDPSLELAAMSLGASRATAVRQVTLPLIAPAIVTAAVFAFLASFDDATVSFFISGVNDKSLPRKMFENIEFNVSPVVAVVSTLVTALTLSLVGGIQVWTALRARRVAGSAPAVDAGGGPSSEARLAGWRAVDAIHRTVQASRDDRREVEGAQQG